MPEDLSPLIRELTRDMNSIDLPADDDFTGAALTALNQMLQVADPNARPVTEITPDTIKIVNDALVNYKANSTNFTKLKALVDGRFGHSSLGLNLFEQGTAEAAWAAGGSLEERIVRVLGIKGGQSLTQFRALPDNIRQNIDDAVTLVEKGETFLRDLNRVVVSMNAQAGPQGIEMDVPDWSAVPPPGVQPSGEMLPLDIFGNSEPVATPTPSSPGVVFDPETGLGGSNSSGDPEDLSDDLALLLGEDVPEDPASGPGQQPGSPDDAANGDDQDGDNLTIEELLKTPAGAADFLDGFLGEFYFMANPLLAAGQAEMGGGIAELLGPFAEIVKPFLGEIIPGADLPTEILYPGSPTDGEFKESSIKSLQTALPVVCYMLKLEFPEPWKYTKEMGEAIAQAWPDFSDERVAKINQSLKSASLLPEQRQALESEKTILESLEIEHIVLALNTLHDNGKLGTEYIVPPSEAGGMMGMLLGLLKRFLPGVFDMLDGIYKNFAGDDKSLNDILPEEMRGTPNPDQPGEPGTPPPSREDQFAIEFGTAFKAVGGDIDKLEDILKASATWVATIPGALTPEQAAQMHAAIDLSIAEAKKSLEGGGTPEQAARAYAAKMMELRENPPVIEQDVDHAEAAPGAGVPAEPEVEAEGVDQPADQRQSGLLVPIFQGAVEGLAEAPGVDIEDLTSEGKVAAIKVYGEGLTQNPLAFIGPDDDSKPSVNQTAIGINMGSTA